MIRIDLDIVKYIYTSVKKLPGDLLIDTELRPLIITNRNESYDVCRKRLTDFLESLFGFEVTDICIEGTTMVFEKKSIY